MCCSMKNFCYLSVINFKFDNTKCRSVSIDVKDELAKALVICIA
jgi:hypothetical protein